MNLIHTMAFLVFPYLALTVFVVGHAYRYMVDPLDWNARSSELLDKRSLRWASTIFHWGILLTLLGHAGGLLIPQSLYDRVGIHAAAHTAVAYWMGLVVGVAAVVGAVWLLWRRLSRPRIRATTRVNDFVILVGLIIVSGLGLYNVAFGHFDLLYTVAPWIRSIIYFAPRPELMQPVPIGYKLHILMALGLLGFSPFSRLVHIWSVPLAYTFRGLVLFRRRAPEKPPVTERAERIAHERA
jgi:nitrate reductase gamma subunit